MKAETGIRRNKAVRKEISFRIETVEGRNAECRSK